MGHPNNLSTSGQTSEEKEVSVSVSPRPSNDSPQASVTGSLKLINESTTKYTANECAPGDPRLS